MKNASCARTSMCLFCHRSFLLRVKRLSVSDNELDHRTRKLSVVQTLQVKLNLVPGRVVQIQGDVTIAHAGHGCFHVAGDHGSAQQKLHTGHSSMVPS